MLKNKPKEEVLEILSNHGVLLKECSNSDIKDYEIVKTAIMNTGFAIIYSDYSFWNNKEILEIATQKSMKTISINNQIPTEVAISYLLLENYPNSYQDFPSNLKKEKLITLKAIECESSNYKYMPKEFFNDKDVALMLINQGETILELFSDSIKDDEDIITKAILNLDASTFLQASDRLKNDQDLVRIALSISPSLYNYLSLELKSKPEFLIMAIEKSIKYYKNAPIDAKNHIDTILHLISTSNFELIEDIEKWKNIRETAIEFCVQEDYFLEEIDQEFLKDKNFLLEVASRNKRGLYNFYSSISEDFKKDRDIALSIIRNNGEFYRFLPEYFKNDFGIIQESVENNVLAIYEIDNKLIEESEELAKFILFSYSSNPPPLKTILNIIPKKYHHLPYVKKSIEVNASNLNYLSEEYLNDRDLLLSAFISHPGMLVRFPHLKITKDYQFVMDIFKQEPKILIYTDFLYNEEFIFECIKYHPLAFQKVPFLIFPTKFQTKKMLLEFIKRDKTNIELFPKDLIDLDVYIAYNGMYLPFFESKLNGFGNIRFQFH